VTDINPVTLNNPTDRLSSASVEVSSRGHQLDELRHHFSPGIDVTITFLPGDSYQRNVATASALRRSGFNPVLHIAAREMPSREALDDFLARARGEAEATRIVLIAGDVARALGPFKSSLDVCLSGMIEAHGVQTVSVAGHPEGHPHLDPEEALAALAAKRDWGRRSGVRINAISQFCFESGPILAWMQALNARGLDIPVHVGLAGPATPPTLLRFALRCGVGNSLKSLRDHIGRFGRLMNDAGPDDVVLGLRAAPVPAMKLFAGFHIFPFGGLRKTSEWLRTFDAKEESRCVERARADTISGFIAPSV
jgi:methylenetetrahydrofolate reductase (NADPH)